MERVCVQRIAVGVEDESSGLPDAITVLSAQPLAMKAGTGRILQCVIDSSLDDVLVTEMRLLLPEVRASRHQLEDLLAHDFAEVGASGRHWSREALIEELVAAPQLDDIAVSDAVARRVCSEVIQISYVTVSGSRRVIRTSWWRSTDETWKCFFHQGTVDPARD